MFSFNLIIGKIRNRKIVNNERMHPYLFQWPVVSCETRHAHNSYFLRYMSSPSKNDYAKLVAI